LFWKALFPSRKKLLSLAGPAIGTAYVASNPLYIVGFGWQCPPKDAAGTRQSSTPSRY
jgi:hypothetical protein